MRKNANREVTKRQLRRLKAKESRIRAPREISDFALLGRWFFGVGALILTGLVLAAYFTPLMAIQKITITGAERVVVDEVQAKLKPLLGSNLTQVTEEEVAQLLKEFSLIDTIALESRPPSTLLVRIQERQPLAIVKVAGKQSLFDAAGIEIATAQDSDQYPRLIGIGNPKTSEKFDAAVSVLLAMPQTLFQRLDSVELDGSAAIIRVRDHDFDVLWGSATESALKTEVLDSILESLEDSPTLVDVSSPLAPVVKY